MSAGDEPQASQVQEASSQAVPNLDDTLEELPSKITTTPTPSPSPQGGGEQTEFAA